MTRGNEIKEQQPGDAGNEIKEQQPGDAENEIMELQEKEIIRILSGEK